MGVIYADVLFCVNFVVNYVLLLVTSMTMRLQTSTVRMCIGAIIGAICSFVILLPPLGILLNVLIRILISVLTVIASFKIKSLKAFLKITITFLLSGFLFAGMMYAIMQLLTPMGMVVNNSSVYINISPTFIILTTLICYSALSICERFVAHRLPGETVCTVEIEVEGKRTVFKGITDTGNSLREMFSDYPVIIVEGKSVREILPENIYNAIVRVEPIINEKWKKRVRVIPYNTVSGDGVLSAFRPDKVTVFAQENEIITDKIYVAVSTKTVSSDFEAILNSEIITGGV